ncbi:hypothetical protein PLESTB_000088900 [Pleodorina starrii]|uniref:Vps72/YL1 C-terminal domain-containing protein n=1 Tax=Pleodorina starrii TaxID=330485 RepID=A0A9W6EX64_9CHLO|nr:hypothetical protein PLESTM_000085300 [Pleodorina starrii]GLC48372.1 hypothetical protein PLESTB_000088900 [Pleodorina starrii]GLC76575.1 hypothetical protein PLESTF_001799100 [Pleodorina starrii]
MGREKLPERSTRGKRLKQAVDDEEDDADNAFWNQEFFKEEAVDDDYKTESEPEDQIDSDFDVDEGDDDDDEVVVKDDEPRKKALKPPGYKPKPKPKAKPKPKPKQEEDDEYMEEEDGDEEEEEDGEGQPARAKPAKAQREPVVYVAPTLRRSTVARVAEAQQERQYKEKTTRRRAPRSGNSNWRPLTQQELLAEAALNEIENTRSLKALLAQEEETKRKAQVVKKKNTGPSVKFKSRKGPEGTERTTLELINTLVPPKWMQPSHEPPQPDPPICNITGLPARYRDPHTHTPFANTLAFKRLRTGQGPLAPSLQQQLVMHHHMEEAQRLQQRQQPGGTGPGLLEQLRAQSQRAEQLTERARAFAATSAADVHAPEPLPRGVTVDVMALVVDAHRSLMAAAS